MVFIPSRRAPCAPPGTFQEFYRQLCQSLEESDAIALPRWVSIALPLPSLDPLAALQRLGGLEQPHFYWEQPQAGIALAAGGGCVAQRFEGAERFRQTQAFVEACSAVTALAGDRSLPWSGPHFFCSFTFFDTAQPEASFAPANVFLPLWQVSRQRLRSLHRWPGDRRAYGNRTYGSRTHGSRYDLERGGDRGISTFVANVPVRGSLAQASLSLQPLPDLAISRRAWEAYATLRQGVTALLPRVPTHPAPHPNSRLPQGELSAADCARFQASVQRVLQAIETGILHKTVLAHSLQMQAHGPISAIAALNTLRLRHPDCHIFSVGSAAGRSRQGRSPHPIFLGASPERLLRVEHQRLQTEAIAGSAPRGQSHAQDQAFAAALQENPKELHEHQLVSQFIVQSLERLGLHPEFPRRPNILRLRGIQHLQTPIQCQLPSHIHPLEVLAQLHPTPAVAGVPQQLACEQIRQLEGFERSLYASPIGWIDAQGNCDFCVGIRSALIDGNRAQLFAGAGVVQGSKPEQELAEVALKLRTLMAVLTEQLG